MKLETINDVNNEKDEALALLKFLSFSVTDANKQQLVSNTSLKQNLVHRKSQLQQNNDND